MPRFLKRGMDASAIKAADAKVRETVESILGADRGARRRGGARAVAEVRQVVAGELQADRRRRSSRRSAQVPQRDLDDIKFAQAQVRNFAQKQRDDHAGPRGRDAARRRARPPPHPGELDRLLRAGRALSDGRLGAHVDRHREGRRREAHHRLRAAVPRRAASGDRRRDAFRRRGRDLRARRRAGGRRDGARHRLDRARST